MNNSTILSDTGSNCPSGTHNPFFILLACLSGVSGAIAAAGNTIVLLAIYRTQTLQTVSNMLIASLAVVDLIVGIILNPLLSYRSIQFSYIEYRKDLPETFDMIEDFLWTHTFIGTTFCLGAISLDRYVAVTRVFRYHEIVTRFRCYCVITGIWLFSIAFSCARFFIKEEALPTLWLVTAFLGCCAPLSITGFSYFRIFKSAREQSLKIASTNTAFEERRKIELACHRKIAWTISIVIGVFVLFYLPSLIVACVHMFVRDPCVDRMIGTTAWPWTLLISYASSSVNPWIYSMRFVDFRHAFKRAMKCSAS